MAPLRWKKSPHSAPWVRRAMPIAHSVSPTSQPKAIVRRVVRVTTMVRRLWWFMGVTGPQLSGRLRMGGRLPRGASS